VKPLRNDQPALTRPPEFRDDKIGNPTGCHPRSSLMKPICVALSTVVAANFLCIAGAQGPAPTPSPTHYICTEETGCSHQYIDGLKYKIITTDQAIVTVALGGNAKYARVLVRVTNLSTTPIDVLPDRFALVETKPKQKTLAYVPYQKIIQADNRRAGWANAINAFGAGMATQQVSTQTNTNGTVNAYGSDGTYANANYNGTSTSTTSVPNYAAQAQARENIRRRREAIAEEAQSLSQSSLLANSLAGGQSISGSVYFQFDKKVEEAVLTLMIDHVTYEFPFTMTKH
jgi:hypothetical protein